MADDVLVRSVPNKVFREMCQCIAPVVHVVPESGTGVLVFALAVDSADRIPSSKQNPYRWPDKTWRGMKTTRA